MKRVIITLTLLALTSCVFAITPTPTPISEERIKVMVKEVAVDILMNTNEGANQEKIGELFMLISCKYNVALNPMSITILKANFGECVKAIEFCDTVEQQNKQFEMFFNQMETWSK